MLETWRHDLHRALGTVPLMWDHSEFDDDEDDWEPLRSRRARPIRILAILVVIAMVLALVIPVLLRSLQEDEPDEPRPDGVQAAVVVEQENREPSWPVGLTRSLAPEAQ